MSETATDGEEIVARARRMGWKDKHEFGESPPPDWKPAEEFIREGEESLPLMRSRMQTMDRRYSDLLRRQDETQELIVDLTNRHRRAEQVGYDRARKELEAERRRAVEEADTEAFERVEAKLKDLPEPPPEVKRSQRLPPAVEAWAEANPWFLQNEAARKFAINAHGAMLEAQPGLSIEENLRRTTAAVEQMFPEQFQRGRGRPPLNGGGGDEDGAGEEDGQETPPENPRRREPAPAGAPGPAPSRRPQQNTFASLPEESKRAFRNYKRAIDEKIKSNPHLKPLTEAEWAADYYAQENT